MIEHINSNIEETSDFNEWLQAMKMVAYLPDGIPVGFRRKLWLALSDQYLCMKNIDWERERVNYFCNTTQEDDENLGDQIIKDLHRTGTNLCTGPTGSINQEKLKRILQGYARWNPEVGYCQGFNMLGALILQVMDKEEMESMKVMLYIIEGIFPSGYFSGSLNGLQVDMAVFRELMFLRLPKLAKHLQRLQGPADERCCEPPLTNVFTIQWFITMFSTSLPFNSVIRIWDLVLIEGSGILLRTALAIWSILEEKILCSKSADDFYCKMGKLSTDMLNGTIIDSNRLIEKIVEFGPIPQLEQLRKKHLHDIKSWTTDRKIKFPNLDDDGDSDDESDLSVNKSMGMRLVRKRNSRTAINRKSLVENNDRIAIDIPLLKKQYHRIREHQRQAHILLSAAVARQSISSNTLPTNILLDGRNANNIRRNSSLSSAVPPVKRSQYNCKLLSSSSKQNENNSFPISKKISPKLKKRLMYQKTEQLEEPVQSSSILNIGAKSLKRNESSSCSDSDNNSSTSTSLCDDDDSDHAINFESSMELSPVNQNKSFKFKISEYDNLKIYNEKVINQFTKISDEDDDVFKNENIPKLTNDSDNNLQKPKCITSCSVENNVVCANIDNLGIYKTINAFNNETISPIQTSATDTDSHKTKTQISTPIASSFLNKNLKNLSENSFITVNQESDSKDLVNLHIEEVIPKINFDFSVNESGVINKYFERVNDIKNPTNTNLDLLKLQTSDVVPLTTTTSISEQIWNILDTTKAKQNTNTIVSSLSTELFDRIKEPEITSIMEEIFNGSQKTDTPSELSEQTQSELANRIIEENSRVLRRILNKDLTTDNNFSFHSNYSGHKTNECTKYIFNDIDLSYSVDFVKEKSIDKFSQKQATPNLNDLEKHKATTANDIIPENKVLSNNLGNIDGIKNILINNECLTATENCSSESNLDESKSPIVGTINLEITDCNYKIVNDISTTSSDDNKEILPQETKTSFRINTTSFSNSINSFSERTPKFISENSDSLNKVSENNNVLENFNFHDSYSSDNLESNYLQAANNIFQVEPFLNIADQNKEYSLNKICDDQDIDYKYSRDMSLNNYSTYDYIMNSPSSTFEKQELEFLAKNSEQEQFINIGEKENKPYNQIDYAGYDVCDNDNKDSYEECYIQSKKAQLQNNDPVLNLSKNCIQQNDEISTNYISNYDVSPRFTTNNEIKWHFDFDKDHIFDKTYSNTNLSKLYNKSPSISETTKEKDVPLNAIDTQDVAKDIKHDVAKDIKLNIHPVISPKANSEITTSIINDNILSPVLNNKYSNYSKDENINDRLISIKNTIKSIDSLCDDTIHGKLSKKGENNLNNFLPPLYIKKELMSMHNFEERNFMNDYANLNNSTTVGRREPFKYIATIEDSESTKYSDIINTTHPELNKLHTSTLYDRILAQCEKEEQKKIDPLHLNVSSKDIINSTSLNVLTGYSHSAENSPLKIKSEKLNSKSDSKSCNNILLQVQNRN